MKNKQTTSISAVLAELMPNVNYFAFAITLTTEC